MLPFCLSLCPGGSLKIASNFEMWCQHSGPALLREGGIGGCSLIMGNSGPEHTLPGLSQGWKRLFFHSEK